MARLGAQTLHSKVDRFLALLAGACAVHCLVVPIAFALIPSLTFALYSYADPKHGLAIGVLKLARFEWLAALFASSIALTSTAIGLFLHRCWQPLFFAAAGASLLFCVVHIPLVRDGALAHSVFAVTGGVLLVTAHLRNRAVSLRRRSAPLHSGR